MHIGEVGRFQNFRTSVTLTLAWDRVTQHTVVYHSLIDLYTIKFVEMGMTFLYVRADTKTGFLGRRRYRQAQWLLFHHSVVTGVSHGP